MKKQTVCRSKRSGKFGPKGFCKHGWKKGSVARRKYKAGQSLLMF